MNHRRTGTETIEAKVAVLLGRYADELQGSETPNIETRNAAIIGCVIIADAGGFLKHWPTYLVDELQNQGVEIGDRTRMEAGLTRLGHIAFASFEPAGTHDPEFVVDVLLAAGQSLGETA